MEIDKSARNQRCRSGRVGRPALKYEETHGRTSSSAALATRSYTPSPGSISECRLPGWDRGLATT